VRDEDAARDEEVVDGMEIKEVAEVDDEGSTHGSARATRFLSTAGLSPVGIATLKGRRRADKREPTSIACSRA
jgi:hypothetical protein